MASSVRLGPSGVVGMFRLLQIHSGRKRSYSLQEAKLRQNKHGHKLVWNQRIGKTTGAEDEVIARCSKYQNTVNATPSDSTTPNPPWWL